PGGLDADTSRTIQAGWPGQRSVRPLSTLAAWQVKRPGPSMRNSLPDRPCRLNRLACLLRRTTLALATALLLAVAPTAATANRCGTTNGGFNSHITVTGASCTTAR